ncbi:hypothetical protein CHELA41_23322 [Hyphomicrobiales bacterium]|nr:hypothetical protein CHELA41_23322 [Hyphomicrobiales bacterium]
MLIVPGRPHRTVVKRGILSKASLVSLNHGRSPNSRRSRRSYPCPILARRLRPLPAIQRHYVAHNKSRG